MAIPPGFTTQGRLQLSVSSLRDKTIPWAWFENFSKATLALRQKRNSVDDTLFMRKRCGITDITVHVGDITITGDSVRDIESQDTYPWDSILRTQIL